MRPCQNHRTNFATQPPGDQRSIPFVNVRYRYTALHYDQMYGVKSTFHSITNEHDSNTVGGQRQEAQNYASSFHLEPPLPPS